MTMDAADTSTPNLIERARNILMQPSEEWRRIAAETTPIAALVTGYLLPLVAATIVAGLLGSLLMSGFFLGAGALVPMLIGAAAQIVIMIASILLWGVLINALAPSFGSEKNRDNAFRLAIYSATAALVAGLTLLLPVLAFLAVIAGAIYSAILLNLGLPSMMRTPEEKRVPFVLTLVGIALVAGLLMSITYSNVMAAARPALSEAFRQDAPAAAPTSSGVAELTELQKQMLQGGGTTADPARVLEQMPPSLPGGFALASSTSASNMGVSQAEGVYRSSDAELRLTVMQAGAADALAAATAGMNMQESSQSGDGYARRQTIDGRIYYERVSNADGSASYSVIGRGVAVTAAGTNITLDEARAAVETIGVRRLEREFGA
jgi:MFS family permease